MANMDAVTTTAEVNYEDLIIEAFIEPIRNVTVIDDEYPTLSQLITLQLEENSEKSPQIKPENLERLQKIIAMCHEHKNWSIDVFDGRSPQLGSSDHVPPYLNHSDLVLLDYHLDGESSTDDGSRARNIIFELEHNNHFNIILVHTKGNDGDIERVYDEILSDFVHLGDDHIFIPKEDTNELIDELIDDEDYERVANYQLNKKDTLRLCQDKSLGVNIKNPKHPLYSFVKEIDALSKESGLAKDEVVKWLVAQQIEKIKNVLKGYERSDLRWCWENGTAVNYICTGRVFISVVKKEGKDPNQELYERLRQSLRQFDPSPMHLLMAKMRYEIDERGLEQANNIISNRHAQAGWLYNLLANSNQSPIEHDKAIDLHWEQLARASKDELRMFSKKLITAANASSDREYRQFVKRFFSECIGSPDLALGQLNAFSCSMPVTNQHLTTGSIFSINEEVWVCLSPACDLVPGQRARQWSDRIGANYLAFKAVRLNKEEKLQTANGHANKNEHIYLSKDSEVSAYYLAKDGGNPSWDTFYANNQGYFLEGNKLSLSCLRAPSSCEYKGNYDSNRLELAEVEVTVIAELRYEYALNLLQKLGANQTRVGLGFTDKSQIWS